MAVYPDRSEKRTVTCFRSPAIDGSGFWTAPCSNLWPHFPQNAKSDGFEKLHFGQILSNLAPHLPQNTNPSGFSNWHFEHFIVGLSFERDPVIQFEMVEVRLGGWFKPLWFVKSLLILNENFNKNYRLLLKRLYERRMLENRDFRKLSSRKADLVTYLPIYEKILCLISGFSRKTDSARFNISKKT